MKSLVEKIFQKIKKDSFNFRLHEDLFFALVEYQKQDEKEARGYITKLSDDIEEAIAKSSDLEFIQQMYMLHKDVLLLNAPYDFESYMLYIEWDREPKSKFYAPRRPQLKPIVKQLQRLADDEIDILCISLPPGVGKTTLAIFFITWLAGKVPELPILTGSYSNSFVAGVYGECLRLLDPLGEYKWQDVFPATKVVNTNAKFNKIDLGKSKRFETLEFTSLGSGNAGQYRAMQLLYCDDLVSGIEVALSKDRLDKIWTQYTVDLSQRKQGDKCKELHIATRWSLYDIIGRLQQQNEDNPRASFISMPAVDEDGHSNFNYPYGVGFNDEAYAKQKSIMDDASWRALYMNEPIEREGQLYAPDELRRYFELPDREPDAIISACDTKDRGTDYCVMPIAYQYGNDYYIEDVVCDNSKPEIVEIRLVEKLLKNKVQLSRFESNSAGGKVAKTVQEEVKRKGGITHISTKYTTSNKETKIISNSPFIKERFLFKDNSVEMDKDYRRMLSQLTTYTMAGKNKHDDTPDALSQLSEYVQSLKGNSVEVFERPW